MSILVPMLGRPHRVQPLVESIFANTNTAVEVVFLLTAGDHEVEHEVIRERHAGRPQISCIKLEPREVGDYAHKINVGFQQTDSDWVFMGADDLRFHPNWFPHALRVHERTSAGVIGTQDMGNRRVKRGQHATHSLMTRGYGNLGSIDDPTVVLHEGYVHEFVDDEFIGTAISRRQFAFAHHAVVEHLHPAWGKAPWDDMYLEQQHRMNRGRALYEKRRLLWK